MRDAVVPSACRLPVFSISARVILLSAIGRLLLLTLDFGTVYLLTSGLPRHLSARPTGFLQCFDTVGLVI